jgi:hypothetical protein
MMNINSQHHNVPGIQISPKSEDFVFGGHFMPWLPWQRRHFEFVQPPKSCHTQFALE